MFEPAAWTTAPASAATIGPGVTHSTQSRSRGGTGCSMPKTQHEATPRGYVSPHGAGNSEMGQRQVGSDHQALGWGLSQHSAPRQAWEDLPARCQPSLAPWQDPRQRLWDWWCRLGRNVPGQAGCCHNTCWWRRGRRHPSTYGCRRRAWHLGAAPCWMRAANGQCSAPSPTSGAMSAQCSALHQVGAVSAVCLAPAPPLPTSHLDTYNLFFQLLS